MMPELADSSDRKVDEEVPEEMLPIQARGAAWMAEVLELTELACSRPRFLELALSARGM